MMSADVKSPITFVAGTNTAMSVYSIVDWITQVHWNSIIPLVITVAATAISWVLSMQAANRDHARRLRDERREQLLVELIKRNQGENSQKT